MDTEGNLLVNFAMMVADNLDYFTGVAKYDYKIVCFCIRFCPNEF